MKRIALLALLTLACKPRYGEIDLTLGGASDPRVTLEADEIVLPIGLAAVLQARLHSDSNVEYTRGVDELELRSEDRTIALVERTERDWEFVVIGVAVGETCLTTVVNDEEQDCTPVRVVAQE